MGGETDTGSFRARLKRLREAAGLSQNDLALRAGLTAKGISAIERGERKHPYPHTISVLADALGLSGAERDDFFASAPKRTGMAYDDTPGARLDPSVGTLPALPTPLVGRERELAAVGSLVAQGTTRLLTLTGPGGVGKTRLALEVAGEIGDQFPDGVVFLALASLADSALVLPTIFEALGLQEAGGRSVREILQGYLSGRRMLLVLDNFEHVAAAAPDVAGLLEASRGLVVLATSRAALRVRGEQEYPLGPLATPDPSRGADAQSVTASPAARLFAGRAGSANLSFQLSDNNAASVAAICWRLDGLPLAIELAAAKMRFLGPVELLSHLDRALESGAARDLPERHRTMRSTIDWSYDLLSRDEQALFRRLSVFAGGFGLEAIEALAGAEDVLSPLETLVEQSLIGARSDAFGVTRYRMLEPIRQYALTRLRESGEEDTARQEHAEYYLALGERVGPKFTGPGMVEWLDRMEAERDNLRTAVAWMLSDGKGDLAARLAHALRRFFWSRGPHSEIRRWMERAPSDGARTPLSQAQATYIANLMSYRLGEEGGAWEPEEVAEVIRASGDVAGAADVILLAGVESLRTGDLDLARKFLRYSNDLYESAGDEQGSAQALVFLGVIPLGRGEIERADEYFARGLRLARESGNPLSIWVSLYHTALAAQSGGHYVRAGRYYAEALVVAQQTRDRQHVALAIVGLAECSAMQGDTERAARLFGAADAVLRSVGMSFHPIHTSASGQQQPVDLVRERLDPETFHNAWTSGQTLKLEEAIAEALDGHG